MMKQGSWIFIVFLLVASLSACMGTVWTGASMLYDRHNVYKKISDYNLLNKVNQVLAEERTFNNSACLLDIVAFHGDILIAGHVPSEDYLEELKSRLARVKGYRHLFIEIKVVQTTSNSIQDSWITTKIRGQIFKDDSIDPNSFKVVTSDGIVYLMGEAKADEAEKVIQIARSTEGVVKVVKLMKYFTYQS